MPVRELPRPSLIRELNFDARVATLVPFVPPVAVEEEEEEAAVVGRARDNVKAEDDAG
jgi:hypothetical protein